jgi:hypothetical protein
MTADIPLVTNKEKNQLKTKTMPLGNHNKEAQQEKEIIDSNSLANIAIFLEGFKQGRGNLLPLGTVSLEELWKAIKYLRGDVRYIAEKDIKK